MRRAAWLLLVLSTACTTPRYVGSIVRDETFVNRGYGVVLRLSDSGVMARWQAFDPSDLEAGPAGPRPKFSDSPLDLDADGKLDVLERTGHLDPPLRLVNKNDPGAIIDLEVQILGGADQTLPLDALIFRDLKRWIPTSSAGIDLAIKGRSNVDLVGSFKGRASELTVKDANGQPQALRIAWIEQDGFLGEEGIERRQLVRVVLRAPTITDEHRADFAALLKHLLLSRRGSSTTNRETW